MSHFAEIDKDGNVLRVIVAEQDFINSGAVGDSFLWVQTSYNGNFRKQYATIGDTYDSVKDVFISPQPYPSWILDSDNDWQPPTEMPEGNILHENGNSTGYVWNEDTKTWDLKE